MIADDLFSLLEFAAFGAYAVSVDQTILFWNPEAERILGVPRQPFLPDASIDFAALTPSLTVDSALHRYDNL